MFTVVGDNDLRDTEAADDVFPDEGLYLPGSDGFEGLGLCPLGGVVGGDYHVFNTTGTLGHGPDQVNSPLGKRTWVDHRLQWLGRFWYVWGVELTGLALPCK